MVDIGLDDNMEVIIWLDDMVKIWLDDNIDVIIWLDDTMDAIIWLDDMVKIWLDENIDVIIWLDDNVIIWMITFIIIIILGQKLFVWRAFLREKKDACYLSNCLFIFFARKLAKQKVFLLGWWKFMSISTRASYKHVKNLRMMCLLWKIQLQIQNSTSEIEASCKCTYWITCPGGWRMSSGGRGAHQVLARATAR